MKGREHASVASQKYMLRTSEITAHEVENSYSYRYGRKNHNFFYFASAIYKS